MSPVHGIIFDLGRILVDFHFPEAFTRLQPYSPCTPEEALLRLKNAGIFRRSNLGTIDPVAFFAEARRLLAFDERLDFHTFRAAYGSIFRPKPDMQALFLRLTARYRVAILSNTDMLHRNVLEETCPFLFRAHVRVYSFEVGLMKPDAAIYRLTLDRLGTTAATTLFVDDRPENVAGAEACGLTAHLFTGYAPFVAWLANHGVT